MGALTGLVAIVTGAGQRDGIGFAACSKLAKAGARILLTDLASTDAQRGELDARVAELTAAGAQAMGAAFDVTSAEQATQVVEQARAQFGGVDILFNNAGYPAGGPFEAIDDAAWMRSWMVNVMGIVHLCRAALPALRERGGGAIVNNASLAGLGAVSGLSAYAASKFAVVGLTKSLACEFGQHNIRVNAVCPGMVWTRMGREEVELMRAPDEPVESAKARLSADVALQRRWARAEEVGDAVVYLASPQSSYVTGVALPVAGGLAPGL